MPPVAEFPHSDSRAGAAPDGDPASGSWGFDEKFATVGLTFLGHGPCIAEVFVDLVVEVIPVGDHGEREDEHDGRP